MSNLSTFGDIQTRDLAARHGTFFNPVGADTDGSRSVLVDFKGRDSGDTKHQMVTMGVSHSGTGADFKGKYVLGVNSGADSDGALTSVLSATSSLTTVHSAASMAGTLSVTGTTSMADALTVSSGGVNVTGASTFADTLTINGTGTALDVANGNMNVGGTLTVGTFEAATYTGLDLDSVADTASRVAVNNGHQDFTTLGNFTKTFWVVAPAGGLNCGTGGMKMHFWDAGNTNRLWFHEDLKTKMRGTLSFTDVSADANPATWDEDQNILMAKDNAPWIQSTRMLDQAGTTEVTLGRMEFSGQHSGLYRTGAKIHAITSTTQWDGADATIAPTELHFFTQSAAALTDNLTSAAVVIDSNGHLRANNTFTAEGQVNCNKATGYSLVTAKNAKINGYVEMTGITVLSGGTNSIAGDLGLTGALTITQNTGSSISVAGSAPVDITPTLNANGALNVAGAAALTLASGTGLAVTADATVGGTLDVTGAVGMSNTLSLTKASGTGLAVTSSVTVGGDLTVTGALGLTGNLTAVDFTTSGVLTVAGPNVALVVNNNATIGGTLAVTGTASVGALTGTSTADFTGLVSCLAPSGTGLAVTKNATIGGTLAVTGVTTLTGAVTASSTITAAGQITINEGEANVGLRNEGISELVGTVKCLKPAGTGNGFTCASGAVINGKLQLLSTFGAYALDAFNDVLFRNNLEIYENLIVTGTSSFTGDVTAAVATFSDVITANKPSGTGLSVTNNAVVGGTLSAGATTLASGSVSGTLDVAGVLSATKAGQLALAVTGNATIGGTLTTTGATALNGATTLHSATVTNAVTINAASGTGLDVVNANARVGGNLTVGGNLIISGTTTTVNTETLTVSDNIIVVNGTPLESKDSGIVMQRYSDDIVSDAAKESGTLDGAASLQATLPSGLTGAEDAYYAGWYIKITNDSPAGATGQVRRISSYTHSTRAIVVDSEWTVQPNGTSTFGLYNRPFVGLTYDESADEFVLVATALNPDDTIQIQEYLNLHVNNIITAGETTLGGDLVVGNFSISEPGAFIEMASSGPVMKLIKEGADRITIEDADVIIGTGDLSMADGKIVANASVGHALQVTSGSAALLNTGVTGTLTVTGGGSFSDGVTFNGSGDGITCTTNIDAVTMSASGTLTIEGTGDLDCDGLANFSQPVTLSSSLAGVSSTFSSTLGVTGVATFTAQSVFSNGFDANGSSDIETLVVSGAGTALTVTNNLSAAQLIAGASGIVSNGPLDINSTSDFSDTLTCSKASGDGLSVVAGSNLQGTVTAGGDVNVSGALSGAAATFSGTLSATGAGGASVTNALSVGSMSTTGTIAITGAGNLDCDGAADFASTVSVTGLLSGTAASLSTTLGVTGIATFTAQSVHNGGIDVNAASDITNLTVSGSGTGLAVTNNVTVGGTLSVTGTSTFTGLSTFAGGIDVNAASDISSLTVSGAGTSLSVNNTASLGALTVAGTASVTGASTLVGGFDANAASTVSKLTIDGTDTTSLIVDQGASIAGALDVTGASTFTGATAHNGGITATSGTFSGAITSTLASGTGLDVTANAELKGKCVVGPGWNVASEGLAVADANPVFAFYHHNANIVSSGNLLGEISANGRDAGAWRKGASIRFKADGAWSNSNPTEFKAPSSIEFRCEDGNETENTAALLTMTASSITASVDLIANAPVDFNDTLDVQGKATFSGVTQCNGTLLANGANGLSVTFDADIDRDLTVLGVTHMTGSLTTLSTATVGDTLSVTKASGTGLDVTADATIGGTLTVNGNLNVTGSTVTIDTAVLQVEDHNIELGVVASPTDITADGGGITLKGTTDKTIAYDNGNSSWDHSEHVNVASGKEYRINDVTALTDQTLHLGTGAGDGVAYLGDDSVDGSWKIDVKAGALTFSKKVSGSWVVKQTIG